MVVEPTRLGGRLVRRPIRSSATGVALAPAAQRIAPRRGGTACATDHRRGPKFRSSFVTGGLGGITLVGGTVAMLQRAPVSDG